jgi:hypothetical protein
MNLFQKQSIERVLHARPQVADLLGRNPCKIQSQDQMGVIEYETGFALVMEDLRGTYRICAGFKD